MLERKVIVLPGFSPKNQTWLEETGDHLQDIATIKLVHWPHWESGITTDKWIEQEVDRLHQMTARVPASIIAKSVGSLVMVIALEKSQDIFNKIIICGLPLNDLDANDKEQYQVLAQIPPERVLIIQNDQDSHGNYNQVQEFLSKIGCKDITLISHQADNHDYPYWNDFRIFLTS